MLRQAAVELRRRAATEGGGGAPGGVATAAHRQRGSSGENPGESAAVRMATESTGSCIDISEVICEYW